MKGKTKQNDQLMKRSRSRAFATQLQMKQYEGEGPLPLGLDIPTRVGRMFSACQGQTGDSVQIK